MRLVFSGADSPIEVNRGRVRTVEMENPHLFTRVCRSFIAGGDVDAFEPFSLWDGDGSELAPVKALLVVTDPLRLPWDSADLAGKLPAVMESLLFEDEDARSVFESYGRQLAAFAFRLTHQVECDYRFNVEWDVRRYLKAFGFAANRGEGLPYIEMLNTFLDFASDMQLKKVLVFVNLKTFLSENEFEQFLDRVFFHEFTVLLLESKACAIDYEYEDKTVIDQHFLEI